MADNPYVILGYGLTTLVEGLLLAAGAHPASPIRTAAVLREKEMERVAYAVLGEYMQDVRVDVDDLVYANSLCLCAYVVLNGKRRDLARLAVSSQMAHADALIVFYQDLLGRALRELETAPDLSPWPFRRKHG